MRTYWISMFSMGVCRLLRERVDAVEEVLKSRSHALDKIRILLRGLPDLVRGLCRIQYGKVRGVTFLRFQLFSFSSLSQCTPRELATLLTAYQDVATAFEPMQDPSDASFVSSLLNSIVFSMPMLREPVTLLLSCINLRMAKDDEKAELWVDEAKYPAIQEAKEVSILYAYLKLGRDYQLYYIRE
jgi:DNA mismatch repair protein MSH3